MIYIDIIFHYPFQDIMKYQDTIFKTISLIIKDLVVKLTHSYAQSAWKFRESKIRVMRV